jgi:hypothetical protein
MTGAHPSQATGEKTSNINGQKILLWMGVIFLILFCLAPLPGQDWILDFRLD